MADKKIVGWNIFYELEDEEGNLTLEAWNISNYIANLIDEDFAELLQSQSFEAESKTPFVWCVVRAFNEDDGSGMLPAVENTEVLGVFKYKKDADKALKSVYNEMKSQGLEEDYDKDGFYTDNGFIHTTKSKLGQLWMPYGAYRFWNAESFNAESKTLDYTGNFSGSHDGVDYDVSYECSHDIDNSYEAEIRDYVEAKISNGYDSGYESFEMSTGFYEGEIEIEGTVTWESSETFDAPTGYTEMGPRPFYGNPRKMALDRWGNRRFIRRRKDGTYMKNVDVGRSLAMDRRRQSQTWAPAGYRDQGDGSPSLLARLLDMFRGVDEEILMAESYLMSAETDDYYPSVANSESDAYIYAYNDGHSDGRANTVNYRPSTTDRELTAFKKIFKQAEDESFQYGLGEYYEENPDSWAHWDKYRIRHDIVNAIKEMPTDKAWKYITGLREEDEDPELDDEYDLHEKNKDLDAALKNLIIERDYIQEPQGTGILNELSDNNYYKAEDENLTVNQQKLADAFEDYGYYDDSDPTIITGIEIADQKTFQKLLKVCQENDGIIDSSHPAEAYIIAIKCWQSIFQ